VNELPPLTFDDVRPVLVRLADVSDDLILVGGQALDSFGGHKRSAFVPKSPFTLPDCGSPDYGIPDIGP